MTFANLISTKSGFRMRNDLRPPVGIPFINKHKTPVGIEWFFKRMATNNNIGMKYYFRHRKWHGRYLFSQMCLAILLLQGPFQRFIARRGRVLARTTWILPLKSLWSSIAALSSPLVAKPVTSSKVCMYVVLGLPSVCPCCGCHNTSFDASFSLWLLSFFFPWPL